MIFLIFVPKIIGPTLGNIAAKNSDVTYMENGAEKVLPTEAMFLYAAIVAALIFIPMLAFLKKDKERAIKEREKDILVSAAAGSGNAENRVQNPGKDPGIHRPEPEGLLSA